MNKGKATPEAPQATSTTTNRLLDPASARRPRHAAITRNLYTWSNYKNWAEKMRTNWDDKSK